MEANNFFEPKIEELARLDPAGAVNCVRDILHAEAAIMGIIPTCIDVPSNITVSDGGIDALVETDKMELESPHGLIFPGHTRYQIKAGEFSSQDSDINKLIFKPSRKKKTKNEIHERLRFCLEKKGTFVIILTAYDNPSSSEESSIENKIFEKLKPFFTSLENSQIKIIKANTLAKILASFPQLSLSLKNLKHGVIHGVEYIEKCTGMMGDTYITPKNNIVNKMRDAIEAQEFKHIRIIGEPGIGKTRFIYEVINKTHLAPISLYCKQPQNLINDPIISYIYEHSIKEKLILIVDECNAEIRSRLHEKLQHSSTILITIFNELDSQDGNFPYYFFPIPALTKEQISQILLSYQVPAEQANNISNYCSGSPRVAHVVGSHLKLHPAEALSVQLTGISNIWDSFIAGNEDKKTERYRQRYLILMFIALFRRFGWADPVKNEAKEIFQLIKEKAEPNLSWSTFENIIEELINRRVLQGYGTLYITPKLLHIKLWSDWFEKHSINYPIEDLFKKLKGSLHQWFCEMLLYAKESSQTVKIVQNLLGANGIFYDLNNYQKSSNGKLFFILAQTEPGSALNAIINSLRNKDRKDLLEFKKGRREVINALEQIALYGSYFKGAACCLQKLAEAENESWSNNATGIFIGLFSFGIGNSAPTELTPLERLPIFKNLLESKSDESQKLACSVFEHIFQAHQLVHDIRMPIILNQKFPNGWTPKTYEEIYNSHREYLSIFWQSRCISTAIIRNIKTDAILKNLRSFLLMPHLNNLIFDILKKISDEDNEGKLKVLQSVTPVLHYQLENSKDDFFASLRKFYEDLIGDSIESKLNRYIRMNIFEDRLKDEGEEKSKADIEIKNLASQLYNSQREFKNELKWLVTDEAKNGHMLGYELGLLDNDLLLWNNIFSSWIEAGNECSTFFISGYLRGIYSYSKSLWNSLIDQIAVSSHKKHIVTIIYSSGMTNEAALLILSMAKKAEFNLLSLRQFIYGGVVNSIPKNILIELLRILINKNSKDFAWTALELFHSSVVYQNIGLSDPDILDICVSILMHECFFQSQTKNIDTMIDFYWGETALYLFKHKPNLALKVSEKCLINFDNKGNITDGIICKSFEFLQEIIHHNPNELWDIINPLIVPPLSMRGYKILKWLRGNNIDIKKESQPPFIKIPHEIIISWIDDREDRASLIANYFPIEMDSVDNFSSSFQHKILEKYGHFLNVIKSLSANFYTESWWGNRSSHYQKKLDTLEAFNNNETNPNVKNWLNNEIQSLKNQIDMAKITEERDGF